MTTNENLPENRSNADLPSPRLEDYKAFYHWLNAKPDSEVKIYPETKRIKREDIVELNEKILEKLANHDIVSNQTTVNVNLGNNRVLSFGSFEQFQIADFVISTRTKSINITWDFYVQLPGFKLPQRHTLKLRLGSHIRPSDFLHVMFQGDDDTEYEETFANAVCKIDFINPVLSSELFAIVSTWHEALPKNFYTKKINKLLKRHIGKIQQATILLFMIAGIFLMSGFFRIFGNKLPDIKLVNIDIKYFFILLFSCSIFVYLFYIMGKFWSNRTERTLRSIEPLNIFDITRGDRNSIEEINEKNKKNSLKILYDFLIALGVNILSFFICFLIEQLIK